MAKPNHNFVNRPRKRAPNKGSSYMKSNHLHSDISNNELRSPQRTSKREVKRRTKFIKLGDVLVSTPEELVKINTYLSHLTKLKGLKFKIRNPKKLDYKSLQVFTLKKEDLLSICDADYNHISHNDFDDFAAIGYELNLALHFDFRIKKSAFGFYTLEVKLDCYFTKNFVSNDSQMRMGNAVSSYRLSGLSFISSPHVRTHTLITDEIREVHSKLMKFQKDLQNSKNSSNHDK